jgi:hypothetical protein
MKYRRKSIYEYSVEELDKELIARGAQILDERRFQFTDKEGTPERKTVMERVKELYIASIIPSPNKALSHINTAELVKALILKTQKVNGTKGISGEESRRDYYEITDKKIRKNANCVAAICMEKDLMPSREGFSTLRVKNYGKTFNLCQSEPFYHQNIAAGRLCTGFLVKEDIIATAGHCACEKNVTDLRFLFSYKMSNSSRPVTEIPKQNVYNGVRIVCRAYNRKNGVDWALVKIDRKVVRQEVVTLSKKKIFRDMKVYIIGYPLGLPLKYSPGASVSNISETHFSADLNVYSGSSGSPVFDSETHEVIGIVVRGHTRDFRLVENCWRSVIYSMNDRTPKEPQCTRVSQFIDIIDKCCE